MSHRCNGFTYGFAKAEITSSSLVCDTISFHSIMVHYKPLVSVRREFDSLWKLHKEDTRMSVFRSNLLNYRVPNKPPRVQLPYLLPVLLNRSIAPKGEEVRD